MKDTIGEKDDIKELYNIGTDILKNASIQESSDVLVILEYVTGILRARYLLIHSRQYPKSSKQYLQLIQKRAEHIPLQHLTGIQSLWGWNFM